LLVCVAAVAVVPSATAAARDVTVQATPASGQAPLTVTFTAIGAATSVRWTFGDGAAADGPAAVHTYARGRWTASWEAQTAEGAPSTGTVQISAYGLTFAGPRHARYARSTRFTGSLVPAERGVRVTLVGPTGNVASSRTQSNGSYALRARIRVPGPYAVTSPRAPSPQRTVRVVPRLTTRFLGSAQRGGRYELAARVVPAAAGLIGVRVTRRGRTIVDRTFGPQARLRLDTRRIGTYRIAVVVAPNGGYDRVVRVLSANVVAPRLAFGSRGAVVAQLASQLRQLHYAAPASATFDSRLLDAVYAFEKVQGLSRTGVVDALFWQRLADPYVPRPRYAQPADHLEIDKPAQVLYVVRHGVIAQIVPVSTAGLPGKFTPVGRFSIIRKVSGFDPSPLGTLYDPMYFVGGYAIHGNPSVPPYPASHGCVRVPMWIAPSLYATNPYGETVYVY
jgi:L,D-transpeptidase-like protein/PKD domain-containing protein/putative peptidoglycan binding protein